MPPAGGGAAEEELSPAAGGAPAGAPAAGPDELLSLEPAGPDDDSEDAAAGGVASVAGAGLDASCLEQAASISAAMTAVRASLVFMKQYPEEEANGVRPKWQTN